jgi:6-phosphogluconolactonase/glucosamine-6-phosphate isomerase/deaminase
MNIGVFPDGESTARAVAKFVAAEAAVAARRQFAMAVSGGRIPSERHSEQINP